MSPSTALTCGLVILLWGASPVFEKLALRSLEPKELFLARFYLTFVFLLTPMVLGFDGVRLAVWRADRRVVGTLFACAALPLAGLFLYYKALGAGEASKVVPFTASFPLVTFVLSTFILQERLTAPKAFGTALVLAGAWLLAL